MTTEQDAKDAGGAGRETDENKPDGLTQSGSPGPTPGSAEGDRQTVEQDLDDAERTPDRR
jgi:hypothetical protein